MTRPEAQAGAAAECSIDSELSGWPGQWSGPWVGSLSLVSGRVNLNLKATRNWQVCLPLVLFGGSACGLGCLHSHHQRASTPQHADGGSHLLHPMIEDRTRRGVLIAAGARGPRMLQRALWLGRHSSRRSLPLRVSSSPRSDSLTLAPVARLLTVILPPQTPALTCVTH